MNVRKRMALCAALLWSACGDDGADREDDRDAKPGARVEDDAGEHERDAGVQDGATDAGCESNANFGQVGVTNMGGSNTNIVIGNGPSTSCDP